jgi:4-hydroxybenzoate polyprenyltransferase
VKIFSGVTLFDTPTRRLLNSSTVVAISGGLRLHVAFLLTGIAIRIPEYIAFALIVYATYTLDRTLDCKEDILNRGELAGADKRTGMAGCFVAFLLGTAILMHDGIWLAPLFPFIVGYIYSRGIRIGSVNLRFKAGAGVKNIVIGITWGGTMALIVNQWCSSLVTVGIIFLFFGLKVFITSCVNDFKDIRGDLAAGIRTLPVTLGETLTKLVLIGVLIGSYVLIAYALFSGFVRDEWILLAFGFLITLGFLVVYTPSFEKEPSLVYRKMREFVISWETVVGLALQACITL